MRLLSCAIRSAAVLVLLFLVGNRAVAQLPFLDPRDFPVSGQLPTAPGVYTINTTGGTATLTGPAGSGFSINGTRFAGYAVFDFSSLTLNSGQILTGPTSGPPGLPVALLSRNDIVISPGSAIRFDGLGNPTGGDGGLGGSSGGSPGNSGGGLGGGVAGSIAVGSGPSALQGGGGGGGFGGLGGAGASVSSGDTTALGGVGGRTYAPDFGTTGHTGGSGGAGGGPFPPGFVGGGGGGGGGEFQLGARLNIDVFGSISATGGPGSAFGGGGGSGGDLFLHSNVLTLRSDSIIDASGGNGAPGGRLSENIYGAGGGGSGGRVIIRDQDNSNNIYIFGSQEGHIKVDGGAAGGPGAFTGGVGVIAAPASVPEPSALVLAGTGLLAIFAIAWLRRWAALATRKGRAGMSATALKSLWPRPVAASHGGGANRQRIAELFPTAHRVASVASDRQRIAEIGVGPGSGAWNTG